MNVFSQVATFQKNKLDSDAPFLMLVEVKNSLLLDAIHLANNTEDVTWRGEDWIRFPIEVDSSSEDGKTIPSLKLKISNCGGIVQQYIQQYNGLVDSEVNIYVVLASNLSNENAEFELNFLVNSTSYDEQWITFALGASSELVNRFPSNKYIADFCPFVIRDIKCGYTGTGTCCNNLDSCLIPSRFGGEPGMSK